MASGKISMKNIGIHLDVGHDSIGWCVTEKNVGCENFLSIPGAGVVLFPADDCLANERRSFRRQRRHIRATRQRISRMRQLLLSMGVLNATELDKNITAAPWKLAAQVFTSNKRLSWIELWAVLRWYAHNRGYDGNRLASARSGRVVDDEDAVQNEKANALMVQYGTSTMAETMCKAMKINPDGKIIASQVYFKGNKVSFSRSVIVQEVVSILEAHKGVLAGVDDKFIKFLVADPVNDADFLRQNAGLPFRVQDRYLGGILFGQLAPRFDNRVIGKCPIDGDKLPNKASREFYIFRWAMMLANIRVDNESRKLTAEEIDKLNKIADCVGGFNKKEFKDAVCDIVGCEKNNIDALLTAPDSDKSLTKFPGLYTLKKAGVLKILNINDESDKRMVLKLANMLFRGKKLSLKSISQIIGEDKKDAIIELANPINQPKRGKKKSAEVKLMEPIVVEFQSGRAPYSRQTMLKAVKEVFEGKHPMEKGGILFRNSVEEDSLPLSKIDQSTNNHLIRHRVKIVLRLINDIINNYANGDKNQVDQVTVEMARDLKDMSGKKNKEIVSDMLRRTAQHREAAEFIADKLGHNVRQIPPVLIRKVRIAMDMDWTCPYTHRKYDIFDITSKNMHEVGTVDKDHILPRSKRATDSLDSLVLTYKTVNELKGARTGLEFIRECAGERVAVSGSDKNAQIVTESMYKSFIEKLKLSGHSDDRKRQKQRKVNLLRVNVDDVGMTEGMLTRTSYITTLAIRAIRGYFVDCKKSPRIVSIPGRVTSELRNNWNLFGILAEIDPRIRDEYGLKLKQEIRGITHMHHAVDAITLGLAATLLPIDGTFYSIMCKRRVVGDERRELEKLGIFSFGVKGEPKLIDLPEFLRNEIKDALSEQRVVFHIPKERHGLKVDQNVWGVDKIENNMVYVHQRARNEKTRKIEIKNDIIPITKAFGVLPTNQCGKLKNINGILQISTNYGVIVSDSSAIIRHHRVWNTVGKFYEHGGKYQILRRGGLVKIEKGRYQGIWRVASVKDVANSGIMIDMIAPYAVKVVNKVEYAKINVNITTLIKNGLRVLCTSYIGVPCPIISSISQQKA